MIACGVLVLLALALLLSLPSLVDVRRIQAELKTTIKQATGLDVEIQDGIEVNVLPYPHVRMKNLYISNVPGAATSFLLSVRSMDMKLRPTSLFSAHPVAESIAIDGVVVELERLKNGHLNWQEMAHYVAAAADRTATSSADSVALPDDTIGNIGVVVTELSKLNNMTITNAELHFTDSQFGVVSDYSDIALDFSNDMRNNQSLLKASMNYGDLPLRLNAELEEISQTYAKKSSKSKIRFESDLSSLNYEGSIGYAGNLQLKGKSVFESKNITRWIKMLNGGDFANEKVAASAKPVPLKLESNVDSEGARILFPSINVSGGVFAGNLQATLKMPVTWEIKGTLDSVNLDTVLDSGIFTAAVPVKKTSASSTPDSSRNLERSSVG